MPEIQKGDHVEYAPVHTVADPKTTKSHSTGEVVEVNEKPKKGDPEHKTYTIENDNTGKQTTYGARSITKILDE